MIRGFANRFRGPERNVPRPKGKSWRFFPFGAAQGGLRRRRR